MPALLKPSSMDALHYQRPLSSECRAATGGEACLVLARNVSGPSTPHFQGKAPQTSSVVGGDMLQLYQHL
jgi:hypothetical protein